MNNNSHLKYGVYLSYISLFVTNITNIVITPFIVRNLGQSEYGLYMLIGAFVGYIAILDFGLSNTTVRFVAKYRAENNKKDEENFIFSTAIIYCIISIVILIVGTILFFNLESIFGNGLDDKEIEVAKIMFVILVLSMAITIPLNLFKGIITAYERFVFPRLLTIIRVIMRAIIILVLLSLGFKAVAIVLVDAILNLLMTLGYILYVFVKLNVRLKFHNINLTMFKEIFSYSFLIFVSVIVDQIYWRIGHLVLGVVASTSEVALFSIGILFGQYYITFSTAISGVFLPKITKMIVNNATGEDLTRVLIKTGRLQFIILGLILGGFILFGNSFINLWVGYEFKESWIIALTIMIPLTIVLSQTIGISILQAKNMHGFRAISYLCIALLNVLISIYFAKLYGAIGATLGTTLSLVLGNIIIMNLYYHFKVKLNIVKFFKGVFGRLLIPLLCSVLIGSLLLLFDSESWLRLFVLIFIYVIIYFLLIWSIGMDDYEKRLVSGEFKKIINKLV